MMSGTHSLARRACILAALPPYNLRFGCDLYRNGFTFRLEILTVLFCFGLDGQAGKFARLGVVGRGEFNFDLVFVGG